MIHILLLILKMIGVIIAVILGILVLLVCVVIFTPVRYQLDASCDGALDSLKVTGKVTWLLHLFRVDLIYEGRKLTWKIRAAWKRIKSEPEDDSALKEEVKDCEKELEEELEKELEELAESGVEEREKESETSEKGKKASEKKSSQTTEKSGLSEKTEKKHKADTIKCTIQKICDKIKLLSEKKEKIMEAVSDEVHKKAFIKTKNEVFKLLRRWKPKKLKADIHYGFEDPCLTGQVLAGLSVIYPFVGEHLEVEPDFENKVLEGSLQVKGNIRMFPIVCLLWNLVWCREVRKTYFDIKNFEL
ncbi:MAG: DUF2953 domain-containing protein [Dorea sp.]|nr:DUF2953 domain-containing protein [Dorea sp.]